MDVMTEAKEVAWLSEIKAVNEVANKELKKIMEYGSYETIRALRICLLKDLLFGWSPEREARYRDYAEKYGEDKEIKPFVTEELAMKFLKDLKELLEIDKRGEI
jgi:hypothetical protein